jgi:hypothetical protein
MREAISLVQESHETAKAENLGAGLTLQRKADIGHMLMMYWTDLTMRAGFIGPVKAFHD